MLENLPFPWVHYPNHYGAFHAFSKDKSDFPALCDCARGAVANYIELREVLEMGTYSDARVAAPLSSRAFPTILSEESLNRDSYPMHWLKFEPRLCHRCNLAAPSLLWCVEMYGGKFKQVFGWYIQQTMYRFGVMPMSYQYLRENCPEEIVKLIEVAKEASRSAETERLRLMKIVNGPVRIDIASNEITYWHNVKLEEAAQYQKLQLTANRRSRKLSNYFENITREEFGFRKIGDAYVNESLLFKIVQRLFPDNEIVRHQHPKWLQGLELDIYIPEKKLAFEYQGQQHFHPIKAWGGEKALAELQKRDAKKHRLCDESGIDLIVVDYTEPLTESYIRKCLLSGAAGCKK